MKRHLQCAEQQVSRSNLTKYCACHAERLTYLVLITYETSFTVRGATGVTIQPHQILRLSRRKTHILSPHRIWNVIYSARSNRCHHPTSPNTAPATKNDSTALSSSHMKRHFQCAEQQVSLSNLTKYCACHEKWHCKISKKISKNRWNVISNAGSIRAWSDHDPSMKTQTATRLATEVTFRANHEHFLLKNTTFRAQSYIQTFTKYCACHEKCHLNFTKYCACHEKWHLNFTKYCACHEKWHLNFTKYCACHEKWHLNFTKYCTCHEKWHLNFTKYCACHCTVTELYCTLLYLTLFYLTLLYLTLLYVTLLYLALLYLLLFYLTLLYLTYSTWFYSTWFYSTWPTLLDSTLLDSTLFDSTLLDTILLDFTLLDSTLLDSTLLDSTLLDTILLDSTLLDTILLDSTLLDTILLDSTLLDSTLLDSTLLDTTLLDSTLLDSTLLDSTLLDSTLLDSTLLDSTLLDLTLLRCRSYIGSFWAKLPLIKQILHMKQKANKQTNKQNEMGIQYSLSNAVIHCPTL